MGVMTRRWPFPFSPVLVAVGGVRRRDLGRIDDPGVGFHTEVRLEPVLSHCHRLVAMSCLWVDCRDHPVLGDPTRYALGPVFVSRLDVLGRDEGEHPDGVLLL
jgi:hypothetical protein